MNLLRSCILLLFLIAATAHGQISISSADLLGLIGDSFTLEGDASGSIITVDVGSDGANQSWDLSEISFMEPLQLQLDYISPGDTPYPSEFPSANLAFRIPFNEFGYTGVGYNFIDVQSSQVIDLGFAAEITEPDSSIINFSNDELVPLPLTYPASWTSSSADTLE